LVIDYQPLLELLRNEGANAWAEALSSQLDVAFDPIAHGDLARWLQVLQKLPLCKPSSVDLFSQVRIGGLTDLCNEEYQSLESGLRDLCPWRKGPYHLFGLNIDTEWRSDWKWDRLNGRIKSLKGRRVLDVGCGNGYHCWRMLGAGAQWVVGVDPMLLSVIQFWAVRHFYGLAPVYVLPFALESLPKDLQLFDTVFSMGVLYHRRSPIDHLLELKGCLRSGGELVLETLVIEGDEDRVLLPYDRYAKMRNVWFIPSYKSLMLWLRRCGFNDVNLVDVTKTSVFEQRSTDWMQFQSLKDFLNPENEQLTIEGHPAPARAIVTATVS